MKKLIVLVILIGFALNSKAQTELNNYKYAVIPLQYDFLKGKDVYRLNTLTRVLFKEEGFATYFNEEQLPPDLFKDRCLAIYADVKKVKGGFFKKKLQIIIKDCNGRILIESEVGGSKENNHQKAYNMALREAFKSIEKLNYKYTPQTKTKEEKDNYAKGIVAVKPNKTVEEKAVEEKDNTSKELESVKSEVESSKNNNKETLFYYMKNIEYGFEVVDSDSKLIMTLFNTAAKDIFIVKGKSAIVFKQGEKWIYSENNGSTKSNKVLNIKF